MKTNEFLSNRKQVRMALLLALGIFTPLLVSAVLVAAFFGPTGYSFLTHFVSDLGSFLFTPNPFLFDVSCIVGGLLTIPITIYLEKVLAPIPRTEEELQRILDPRMKFRLSSYGFLFGLMGNIGLFFVGIFSEDLDPVQIPMPSITLPGPIALHTALPVLHAISAMLAFGGFVVSAFFFGLLIVLSKSIIPKYVGLYGIFGPLLIVGISIPLAFLALPIIYALPLVEWILFFVLFAWVIFVGLVVLFSKE